MPTCMLGIPFWNLVLACHAWLLAWNASVFLWRLLQVARQFHTPSFLFVFYPFLMPFSPEIQHNSSQSSVP
ncbi:hypothetical protein AHAS_Ahas17G0185100 [Arachis hypogaea]